MAPNIPKQTKTLFLCLISLLASSSAARDSHHHTDANNDSNVIKGMFVFGSSLVDNGNNNFLPNSLAKADYLPYGVDFPLGVTGRFTNGKNVIDLIGEHLKLPSFVPPFMDPWTKGDKIVHGVNFASGGSGILDDTGLLAINVINLNQQIKNFEEVTLRDLEIQLGYKSKESLPNYLFVLGTGGNDYSLNYFLRFLKRPTLQAFTDNLISNFSAQIKKLYDLGGRKFVVMSVNPLGCYPVNIRIGRCNEAQNEAAQLFNANLKTLIDRLKQELPASNLVLVNSYNIITQIIANPHSKGFEDAKRPCCDVGTWLVGGNGMSCKRGGETCTDRNTHVFFDGLHPTEAVNVVIAQKAFASQDLQNEVYPMNISQLVQLSTITI